MNVFTEAAERERRNLPFATVTIIGTEGTVPRQSGRMVVIPDGTIYGTVGGGMIEKRAVEEAVKALAEGSGRRITVSSGSGGSAELFIDIPVRRRSALIVGSGHVGSAIGELLESIGWHVTMFERNSSFESIAPCIDSTTAVIIAGAGDSALVDPLLSTDAFYIGLLSSRLRAVPSDPRVHCPLGIDIGAESPDEIAVAAVSEILAEINHATGRSLRDWNRNLIVVRGAGDLATGTIIRLHNAGYRVIALETATPTVIRRTVAFAEAVYEGTVIVEGVKAELATTLKDILPILDRGSVPVFVDPEMTVLETFHPAVLVDAIIAKRNLGTRRGLAPYVIALGPGFEAGKDADAVIETKRGHSLGSIILCGSAIPNTGVPGMIAGYAAERVIHSPAAGIFHGLRNIGDIVRKGDVIADVSGVPVTATIDGMLRGLLRSGLEVPEGFKIADIDPRGAGADYLTVSDKARAVAGGVLEAVDGFLRNHL